MTTTCPSPRGRRRGPHREAVWEVEGVRRLRTVPTQTDAGAILSLGNWDKGGWTQLDIGRMDSAKLADLVRLAWRQVAPKRLSAGERP